MKANDYMHLAAQASDMRAQITTPEGDPLIYEANLCSWELLHTAKRLKRLGEAQAECDRVAAAETKVGA